VPTDVVDDSDRLPPDSAGFINDPVILGAPMRRSSDMSELPNQSGSQIHCIFCQPGELALSQATCATMEPFPNLVRVLLRGRL
jgi:hypothetical protein